MNDEIKKEVITLSPFKKFCMTIGELPASYLESMTYYESLVWLCNYLGKTVIPTVNNNGEAVTELQNLFVELQTYVNDYFENLDVQEEINNKLDEMVEEGTLQEIISEYLNSRAVFGYDTVADMKSATNLIDGSYARTMGYYSLNDGGNALYKITDTEPSNYYETLTSGLYAELINGTNVKQYGAYGDDTHDDSNAIQTALNSKSGIIFPKATYKLTSSIEIMNKKQWSMNANDATFDYTGDGYAFELKGLEYCDIDFGTINALAGNCVSLTGEDWQDYSQYNNFSFNEMSALNDCIYVELNGGCWISENRLTNGRFHAGNNGLRCHHNSSAGCSHWVLDCIGVEGVTNGLNFTVGEFAEQNNRGFTQWEISNIRHEEATVLLKSRGLLHRFLIIAPKYIAHSKIDVDSGCHLCKIVNADRCSYIYNGVYSDHNVDMSDNIVYNTDVNGDESNIAIIKDTANVRMTDNIATVNLSFYASALVEQLGNDKLILSGLPKPDHTVYVIGTNYGKDEAMPRFKISGDGTLKSSWSGSRKIYTNGSPCIISVSYSIASME